MQMAADSFPPAVRTAMLAPPLAPIEMKDFVHHATPAVAIRCRLHHMSSKSPDSQSVASLPRSFSQSSKDHPSTDTGTGERAVSHELPLVNDTVTDAVNDTNGEPTIPELDLIFTHGRGSKLSNEAIVAFTEGWARTQTTLNFEDTGDLNRRAGIFRALMLAYPSTTSLGGRSMGARAAVRGSMYSPPRKLIMFTYPLIRGLDERFEELLELKSDVDVLLELGDSDAHCHEIHLKVVRQRMRARTWWVRMVNGDHALWYDPDEKRTALCNIAGQIAARWNVSRDPELTELTDANQPTWTNWMAPAAEPARQQTTFNNNISNQLLSVAGGNFTFNL